MQFWLLEDLRAHDLADCGKTYQLARFAIIRILLIVGTFPFFVAFIFFVVVFLPRDGVREEFGYWCTDPSPGHYNSTAALLFQQVM